MKLGLNRWDWRSPQAFAAGVAEAESVGYGYAFLPVNPLSVPDPYILMAAGAAATSTINFAPMLETPIIRPPAVAAGSIATLDIASDGRAMLIYGIGDTAVRYLGKRPATIAELEAATIEARAYLGGQRLEKGAAQPAWLRHARQVPVWLAAGGPKTLRMAGRVADGVFLRVGTHPTNLRASVDLVAEGARAAGRDPADVGIALIFHTIWQDDPAAIRAATRSMAAGYFEYSPALFSQAGFEWNGPPIEDLKKQVWPDFHHAEDLVESGTLVDFLSDEVAASFSLSGSAVNMTDQVKAALAIVPEAQIIVPHPMPMPRGQQLQTYTRWFAEEVFAHIV